MASHQDEDVSERRAVGRALRELRERAGLSQDDAAEIFAQIAKPRGRDEFTGQAWGAYETGHRKGVHSPALQKLLAAAVSASRDDLLAEVARQKGERLVAPRNAVAERPVSPFLDFPVSESVGRLTMPDDLLRPYTRSGDTIVFDRDRWPTPEEGCVFDPIDGTGKRLVKIFLRADADHFHVAELSPERREFTLPRESFNAFKVIARIS